MASVMEAIVQDALGGRGSGGTGPLKDVLYNRNVPAEYPTGILRYFLDSR